MTPRPAHPVEFRLRPRGPFCLAASSRFVEAFPGGQGVGRADRLDLAFPLEGDWQTVGVRVTEEAGGLLATVVPPALVDVASVRGQVERILSLDVDATAFPRLGDTDPVVRDLQQRYPGLRPVQFHTPYEAAAWAIIGHRIRMTQAAVIRAHLAEELGEHVDFGDRVLPAFPAPDRLARLGPTRGLTERKVDQLRALGDAASAGQLDAARLRDQPRDEALRGLQELPGIGPFSAELILLRGAGDPDAFPLHERRLHRAMSAAYHLGDDSGVEALQQVAERWRPYRTWIALLLRTSTEDATSEIAAS